MLLTLEISLPLAFGLSVRPQGIVIAIGPFKGSFTANSMDSIINYNTDERVQGFSQFLFAEIAKHGRDGLIEEVIDTLKRAGIAHIKEMK
jgi:hypothetical protein